MPFIILNRAVALFSDPQLLNLGLSGAHLRIRAAVNAEGW